MDALELLINRRSASLAEPAPTGEQLQKHPACGYACAGPQVHATVAFFVIEGGRARAFQRRTGTGAIAAGSDDKAIDKSAVMRRSAHRSSSRWWRNARRKS